MSPVFSEIIQVFSLYFYPFYLSIMQVEDIVIHTPCQLVAVMHKAVVCQPPIKLKKKKKKNQLTWNSVESADSKI